MKRLMQWYHSVPKDYKVLTVAVFVAGLFLVLANWAIAPEEGVQSSEAGDVCEDVPNNPNAPTM